MAPVVTCPVHPFAANASRGAGRPRSRFYQIAARYAKRMEPAVAKAFLDAVQRVIDQIDDVALVDALAGGDAEVVLAAIATGGDVGQLMLNDRALEQALLRTSTLTGQAGADILSDATGLGVKFNARNPNVVLYARTQAGQLIVQISDDVRAAVRAVIASGASIGATTREQARVIREIVGLSPNHALAPVHLAEELRAGQFTSSRRLSAADKARIRSRLASKTIDEPFIAEMQAKYARSLRHYRARSIARTETLRASHEGQHQGFLQARRDGHLPETTRRHVVVTPDDRLRTTHAEVPGLNPEGVRLDEPFSTPFGALMNPPWEPMCRCGVALSFGTRPGLL